MRLSSRKNRKHLENQEGFKVPPARKGTFPARKKGKGMFKS
jgi:hypothetical protein